MATTPSPPWIATLAPYQPGKPASEVQRELGLSEIIKLASNENPYGPSPGVVKALQDAAASIALYPEPQGHELLHTLAGRLGVRPAEIVLGNGSNALITNLVRTFCAPGDQVVTGRYGFVAYRLCAQAAGVEVRAVGSDQLADDVDALIAACDASTRILFVANPNNPTGSWLEAQELERLIREVPPEVLLVVDEAYFEYARDLGCPDALELREQRENLVVLRTFSKAWGLAGLRLGYAVGPREVCDRLRRLREPFDVNHLAQVAALAALNDEEHLERCVSLNAREREGLQSALQQRGFEVAPSAGNFVVMETPGPAQAVFEALMAQGVIVRPLAPYGLTQHLRITVGTHNENERFLQALDALSLTPPEGGK